MNARKWSAILSGLVVIAALAATATSAAGLLDLFTHKPPVQVRVRLDSLGLKFHQDFRITKYCGYDFDLRLIHTHNRMGEFDAVLVNESLPISVTVDVYRLNGQRTDRVAHLNGMPQRTGSAPSMTVLEIGNVKLDEGHYRAELSSTGEASPLAGIEADFVVQIPPKTTCPTKGST
jgi:hypothetical protein